MKRKYKHSLWTQLIVILVLLTGITIFSYRVTEQQMQNKIQTDTAEGLKKRQASFLEHVDQFDTATPIRSFIFDRNANKLLVGYESLDSKMMIQDFIAHQNEGIHTFSSEVNTYYYLVSRYDKSEQEAYVFTFLIDDFYAQSYKAIERQVALNSMWILAVVTIILLMWILTIIMPLRKLQKEIQNDTIVEHANYRMDEIGVIRNTINQYQNRIREQQNNQEEFIHNVSHDLKTPITVIKSYAEGIEMGILPHQTVEASAQIIVENADRLNDKVAQFLYLNRLEYLQTEEHQVLISLNEIVKHVIQELQIQSDSIEFEYVEEGIFSLYGNEEQWRIFFENIFSNGLRYAKTYIRVVMQNTMFYIENDGPKIENTEMIFEKFQKGTGGETGLGLVIAKKTAQIHGCDLYVDQGAKVRFVVKK